MIRGIYTACAGMITETLRNDVTANNLANANTAGFKKDVAVTKDFGNMLLKRINDGGSEPTIGVLGLGSAVDQVLPIHTAGVLHTTGNNFDLALVGKGFFTVETPAGIRYTRNGSFTRNAQNMLVTGDGHPVLGQNGPIRIEGDSFHVDGTGRVFVGNIEIDRLRLTAFADEKTLVKEGASLFAAPVQGEEAAAEVRQGCLELSNVNIVAEMVNLIAGYRAYEVNGKAVQAQDQLLDKAVNEVGRT